jgi:tetratricopeptide (TPR) repeat protein
MDRWVRADAASSEWDDDRPRGGPDQARGLPGARRSPFKPKPLPAEVAAEIRRSADTATAHHREVLVDKMTDAVAAYDRGRYQEAARLAKQVANETPSVAAVRQLVGLSAYRSGRWREAIRQLDAYAELTDDVEHVPALMDCHRALGKPKKVADLWTDLRQRSPEPDVLAEARMVAAGMLADRGDLDGAISLLTGAGAGKALRNPSDRHLRQWYALGDLYERAGDLPRARELFLRVLRAEPDAYDVVERLAGLGPGRMGSDRSRRNRKRPASPKSTKVVPT